MRVCHQCGVPAQDTNRFCASCGSSLQDEGSSGGGNDPLLGRTVGGSYTIQEILGVGGMGRVYRAEQATLGRTVAVKVIHPHLLGDEQTVARFYTEARAASRLNHPNSVSVIDFGRTEDGILYLVMEYLKGKDLSLVMYEEGPLPFGRICDILGAALDALAEAHALDIVHRDLKPENIILRKLRTGADLVKVVDFGLATIVGGMEPSVTRPGLVCGTPDYMSPEQARGEGVDGRGDLYSLGVMLFELLTERLPYEDDTPTKVVLRHINDPIPDPRLAAPHRQIPDALADIAIKTLQKSPALRFQTAREMHEAVDRIAQQLRAKRVETTACSECGAENPPQMRFCGGCGARLVVDAPLTRTGSQPLAKSSFRPMLGSERPFVGRGAELANLEAARQSAAEKLAWCRIDGEPGVGKTRLLAEVAGRLTTAGDLVVGAGAHPLSAPVPYFAIRELLCRLLDVDEAGLAAAANDANVFSTPLAVAGVREALEPTGILGAEGCSRTAAVAEAVGAAIAAARKRTHASRVVLIIDDLPRSDGLTQQTVDELVRALAKEPVLLLTAGGPSRRMEHEPDRTITLLGLDADEAGAFLAGKESLPSPSAFPGPRRLLPLYLEQLHAIGASAEDTLPPRLADAILQRVERHGLAARRLLQAACVVGARSSLDVLREVARTDDLSALDELVADGLVQFRESDVELCHPFVAELVEASIPSEARKELHQLAFQACSDRGAPLEVRAEHAYRGGDGMSSLMLLERMGDEAMRRGDSVASVLAYRRALEIARRELLESGETLMDAAILTFSRKLGEALERSGDFAGADGVVREALDLTGPDSVDRAKMFLILGRVAAGRDRRREAMRLFGTALELATDVDPDTEWQLQVAIGRARRAEGDLEHAANAFRRALELLPEANVPLWVRAQTGIELGEVLLASDPRTATTHLGIGERQAREAGALALAARAVAALATIDRSAGRLKESATRFLDAARLAADAGDAAAHRRWQESAAAVEG